MMAEAEATAATAGRQRVNLVCVKCDTPFLFERRPGARGPIPRHCADCRYNPPKHKGHCRYCGIYIGPKRWRCDPCDVARTRQRESRRTERERAARPPKQCRDCGVAIGNLKAHTTVVLCPDCRDASYRATRERENLKRRRPPPTEEELEERRRRRQQREFEANARRERGEAKRKAAATRPWSNPSLTSGERFAIRYRLDPEFNLRQRLRAAFKRKRQGIKLDLLLRSALVRGGRSPQAEQFVGYTIAELRLHLERQFKRGMTWERFCVGDIHIDHIRPLSSFDVSNPDELRAAWALPNLRPLWAKDNLAKAGRIVLLL